VNKAESGDVLEIRYQRIQPYEWGAVFNNPGSLGGGVLPQDYAQGQKVHRSRPRRYEGQVHAQN
jgi:acetamidase/formamidase